VQERTTRGGQPGATKDEPTEATGRAGKLQYTAAEDATSDGQGEMGVWKCGRAAVGGPGGVNERGV
jgi:hypothetical protein